MSLKFKYYEKIVGFFMLSGLFLLLVTVILMGREQKWFQKKITLTTIFNKGDSLSKGMEVKINGLVVGRVNNFGFATDNRISVSFEVYKEFIKKIRNDSYVFKESSSPLGGGFLSLSIGKETSPIATNNTLPSFNRDWCITKSVCRLRFSPWQVFERNQYSQWRRLRAAHVLLRACRRGLVRHRQQLRRPRQSSLAKAAYSISSIATGLSRKRTSQLRQ